MGRITLFTTGTEDCQRSLAGLKKRSIPFDEINLIENPERKADLFSLIGSQDVPAVFFNEFHIGGLGELMHQLVEWHQSSDYSRPLDAYQKEVQSLHDPEDPRLRPVAQHISNGTNSFSHFDFHPNFGDFNAQDDGFGPSAEKFQTDTETASFAQPFPGGAPMIGTSQTPQRSKKNVSKSALKSKSISHGGPDLADEPGIRIPPRRQSAPYQSATPSTPSVPSQLSVSLHSESVGGIRSNRSGNSKSLSPPATSQLRAIPNDSLPSNLFHSDEMRYHQRLSLDLTSRQSIPSKTASAPIRRTDSRSVGSGCGSGESRVQSLDSAIKNMNIRKGGSRRLPPLTSQDSFSTLTMQVSVGSEQSSILLPNGNRWNVIEATERLKEMLPCESLKHKITLYKKCFRVNDAISRFRTAFPEIQSDEAAIAFGRSFQRAGILTHVVDVSKPFQKGDYFFRLQCYHTPYILNSYRHCGERFEGYPVDLVDGLTDMLLQVEEASVNDVDLVDYRLSQSTPMFPSFEDSLCLLQGIDLGELAEKERLALVVNIYNMMIKYAFMKHGVPTTRSARNHFFNDIKINIGGDILSFNDLEHGILRANRAPPGISSGAPFGSNDHRVRLALTKFDHRVHFAIFCYPLVATPLTIHPESLHQDLHKAAVRYCENHTNLMIDPSNHSLHVSQIFQWYRADFGNGDWTIIPRLLERYLEGPRKVAMQAITQSKKAPHVEFNEFDWGINGNNFVVFNPSDLKANEKRLL